MLVKINTVWGEEVTEIETRKCRECKQEKPVSEMESDRPESSPRGKGYRNQCKACRKHKQSVIAKLKKENKSLEPTLNDRCIICNKWASTLMEYTSQGAHKRKSPFVLDHNHKTDEFRGWICFNCNTLLSNADDSIEILKNAIEYLRGNLKNVS